MRRRSFRRGRAGRRGRASYGKRRFGRNRRGLKAMRIGYRM